MRSRAYFRGAKSPNKAPVKNDTDQSDQSSLHVSNNPITSIRMAPQDQEPTTGPSTINLQPVNGPTQTEPEPVTDPIDCTPTESQPVKVSAPSESEPDIVIESGP